MTPIDLTNGLPGYNGIRNGYKRRTGNFNHGLHCHPGNKARQRAGIGVF